MKYDEILKNKELVSYYHDDSIYDYAIVLDKCKDFILLRHYLFGVDDLEIVELETVSAKRWDSEGWIYQELEEKNDYDNKKIIEALFDSSIKKVTLIKERD